MKPEVSNRLKSVHLQNERAVWVRPPRNASTAEHLLIFLDGEFYRDGVNAGAVFDGLAGTIADSWVVFVSHHSADARWVECPCHQPFAGFIVGELIPRLREQFEMAAVRKRILVGLSYTGLAAAYVAIEKPGIFDRVISQSGSFWWNDCWLPAHVKSGPKTNTEFYLDVGTKETKAPVQHREDVRQKVSQIEGVQLMRDALSKAGHSVRMVEFEGGHDFAAWRKTLPEALIWALG